MDTTTERENQPGLVSPDGKDKKTTYHDNSYHVRKVFKIVIEALLFYIFGCLVNSYLNNVLLACIGLIASFVALFGVILSSQATDKRFSLNALTTLMGLGSGPFIYLAYQSDPATIIISVLGTFGVFMVFTNLSRFIKDEDTAVIGGFLLASLWSLVVTGIVMLFFNTSDNVELVHLVIGILLFCGFIAYDTKMMYVRFKDPAVKYDYYMHALNLVLDIINIFTKLVRVLMILSDKNKKNPKK
jgi:FtsH-binding integral membrane protein